MLKERERERERERENVKVYLVTASLYTVSNESRLAKCFQLFVNPSDVCVCGCVCVWVCVCVRDVQAR